MTWTASPALSSGASSPALFIAAFFLAFTWRGMLMYFTGDDVMNLVRVLEPARRRTW